MKKEGIIVIRDILITQMNHWILYPFAITLFGILHRSEPSLWLWMVCSLVPFGMFLVRRYTNHFVIFAVSHLAMSGVFLLMPVTLLEKIVLVVYTAGYLIASLYLRIKTEQRLDEALHPGFAVGAAGILLLIQRHYGQNDWDFYYVVPLIVFLGLYFLQFYLKQYQYFLVVNDSSTGHIPKKEMFRCGMILVLVFCVMGVVVLFLTANVAWMTPVFTFLKAILVWIFRLLIREGGTEEISAREEAVAVKQQGMDMMSPVNEEPFILWVILEKLAQVAVIVLIIGVTVYMIYKMVLMLYERFHDRVVIKEAAIDSVNDKRERCEVDKQKREKRTVFTLLDPKERIRRIYKKEIWANRMQLTTEGRPEQLIKLTADQCGKALKRYKMSETYEKARYSDTECTAEDVRLAKER